MRSFLSKYKFFFYFLLIFIISEIIVNPIGDFPLNDDWSYGKSVLILNDQGKLNIGDFAAMTLLSHLIWGFLFTKVFWFSFSVLRFSTLVSSFAGIAFFYKLILRITENRNLAFFAALILLFNPLYFNLTNTFMTDVNFNTILILCCYFAYDFFKTENRISFLLVFILSLVLVLLRQYGIIVPVCFILAVLFTKQGKWLNILLSIGFILVIFAVLKYYEAFLKIHLSPNASYKFSSNTRVFSFLFWDTFKNNLKSRYTHSLLQLLMYVFPFSLIYVRQIVKKFNPVVILLVLCLNAAFVYFLFKDTPFPYGNIFTNLSLGVQTFHESLFLNVKSLHDHIFSYQFETLTMILKYVFCSVTLSIFTLMAFNGIKQKTNPLKISPALVFMIALFLMYILMMMITESYFDRYHIPLITLLIIMISFLPDRQNLTYLFTCVVLMCFFYLSVCGTKDYLELNRKKWEAYTYLKDTKKIDPDKINCGFEVNCWNTGKDNWWYDFMHLNKFDYLIQYNKEPGFETYKKYEFQRYLPYKPDYIYIFAREAPKP